MYPLHAEGGGAQYRVIVKTGDQRGAGTDSNVFLTIYGSKGDSGERPLDTSANNFERAMTDTFLIKAPDLGEIDRIKIRSDGSGLGASWFLQQVDVLSSVTNTSYHFPFNNWCVWVPGASRCTRRLACCVSALRQQLHSNRWLRARWARLTVI